MSLDTELKNLARLVARDVKAGKMSAHSLRARDFMEEYPDAVLGVVDLVHREAKRKKPDEDMIEAYGYMFCAGLELLRYQIESDRDWSGELVDEVRELLLLLAQGGDISTDLLMFLLNGFVEARLDPGDDLTELMGEMAVETTEEEPSCDASDLTELLDSLLEQAGHNEFDLYALTAEISQTLPPEFRQAIVHFAATAENPVLRDTAGLYLLDPSPEVRGATCEILRRHASSLSPVTLRRMVALRNWLPEDERGDLDAAIKKTRQKQVACASWPKRKVAELLASTMDGAGAQSVFAVVGAGRKRVIAGLLLKQGVGIPDAWCIRDQSKADVRDFLGKVRAQLDFRPTDLDFLHLLVPHYLAIGRKAGNVPAAGLLDFVEATGTEKWHPAELPATALISLMEEGADPSRLARKAIDDAVENSGGWYEAFDIMESWFEDDAEVTAVLSRRTRSKTPARINAILESVLEPRRDKWAERFLWTALWLKHGPDLLSPWVDFFLVGRELHQGRPVKDLPVMRDIAKATVLSDMMRI